jgi:hypothetical protein
MMLLMPRHHFLLRHEPIAIGIGFRERLRLTRQVLLQRYLAILVGIQSRYLTFSHFSGIGRRVPGMMARASGVARFGSGRRCRRGRGLSDTCSRSAQEGCEKKHVFHV